MLFGDVRIVWVVERLRCRALDARRSALGRAGGLQSYAVGVRARGRGEPPGELNQGAFLRSVVNRVPKQFRKTATAMY